MANYLDAYVVPVKKAKLAEYRRMARKAGKVWLDHGALAYSEYLEDDVGKGKLTSYPRSLKLKRDEVVVVGQIVFKSRAARDRVNKKVMKDPRLAEMMDPKNLPFDTKRMFWGGFKSIVDFRTD